MATLHLVNKTTAHDAFARCLSLANPGDAVLLIEDGVYNAMSSNLARYAAAGVRIHVLRTDAEARGVQSKLASTVVVVGERDFVQLVIDHQPIVTWSAN